MNTLEDLKKQLMIKPNIEKQKQFTVTLKEKVIENKEPSKKKLVIEEEDQPEGITIIN